MPSEGGAVTDPLRAWPSHCLGLCRASQFCPGAVHFEGTQVPLLAGPQLLLWSSRSLLFQDHHDCHGLQISGMWSWYIMRLEGAAWGGQGLLEEDWWPLDRSMACLSGTIPSPHGRIPGFMSLTRS